MKLTFKQVILYILSGWLILVGIQSTTTQALPGGLTPTTPFTGRLINSTGQIVSDGEYRIRVRVFNAESGGTQLFEELFDSQTSYNGQVCPKQKTQNGYFRLEMGSCNILSSDAFKSLYNNTSLFIEIAIDFDEDGTYEEVFAPRRRIGIQAGAVSALQLVSDGNGTSTNALSIDGQGHLQFEGIGRLGWGIGGAQPQSTLEVNDATNASRLQLYGAGDGLSFSSIQLGRNTRGSASWFMHHRQIAGETGNLAIEEFDGTNYNQRLTIRPGGNIGIGTTAPTARLQVQGAGSTSATTALNVTNSSGTELFSVRDDGEVVVASGSISTRLAIGYSTSTGRAIGANVGSAFASTNSDHFYVDDCNASNPVGAQCPDSHPSGIGGTWHFLVDNNYLQTIAGGSSNARLRAGIIYADNPASNYFRGNVGIGTTAPAQKLHVVGGIYTTGAIVAPEGTLRDDGGGWIRTYGATGWYNQTYQGGWFMQDTTWIRSYNNKSVYIAATLGTGGSVGIGTSAPGQKLHVVGGIRYSVATANTNTTVCRNSSGDLAGCSSLSSLKNNVSNLSLGLDDVMKLRPVSFEWNSYTNSPSNVRNDLGFIAEEVAAVSPLLGTYNETTGALEGVRYSQLTSLLTRAIQEQQTQISDLTQQIYQGIIVDPNFNWDNTNKRLGIGTTTTNSRLTVRGAGSTLSTSSLDIQNSLANSLLFVRDDGWIGIGTTDPQARLDVRGGVRVGEDSSSCSSSNSGTIRYDQSTNSLQVCNEKEWITFSSVANGSSIEQAAVSCEYIKIYYPTLPNGMFWIDPDGTGNIEPSQVYCELTSGS